MSKANLIHIRGFVQLLTCLAIRLVFVERGHYIHNGCALGFILHV